MSTLSITSTSFSFNPIFFFFNDTATTEIYTLSLHDALPISPGRGRTGLSRADRCLARLGGRVAAVAPAVAEDLVREVEREVGSATRGRGGDRARLAREAFLRPVRLRRDFDRGDVLVVDGWVLSRSEVAVCVYLYM